MTHRKSSNVCPVCGAQGMVVFDGGYSVNCNCGPFYPYPSKREAWRHFKRRRFDHMRMYKNYARHEDVCDRIEKRLQAVRIANR